MTDILIAFIFGVFVGACLLVAVSCMIVRKTCDVDSDQ